VAGKAQVGEIGAKSQVRRRRSRSTAARRDQGGQRTTLNVLKPQQAMVNARVGARYCAAYRVGGSASYAVLSAVGDGCPSRLPQSPPHDLTTRAVHYNSVRDSWAGVRTPDGAAPTGSSAASASGGGDVKDEWRLGPLASFA